MVWKCHNLILPEENFNGDEQKCQGIYIFVQDRSIYSLDYQEGIILSAKKHLKCLFLIFTDLKKKKQALSEI